MCRSRRPTPPVGPGTRPVAASRALRALLATLLALLVGCASARLHEDPDATPCEAGPCDSTATDASPSSNSASRCAEGETCGPHQECIDTEDGIECVCEAPPEDCPEDDEPGTYCTADGVEQHCVVDDDGCIYVDDSRDGVTGVDGFDCNDVNECNPPPGPCLNGGVCIDEPGGYDCACSTDFGGDRCERDLRPFSLGRDTVSTSGRPASNGYLYATVVETGADAVRLEELGATMHGNSSGGTLRIGVYGDSQDDMGRHRPGTLIANSQTGYIELDVESTDTPLSVNILLAANTVYWLVALANEYAGDTVVFSNFSPASGPVSTGWSPLVWLEGCNGCTTPPTTFPNSGTSPALDSQLGIYATVRRP